MIEGRDLEERWRLGRRIETSGGEMAYEVFGEGPALVERHTVYVL